MAELARGGGAECVDGGATQILDLTYDSRAVKPGWLFCCLPGANVDGHDYAEAAVARGASGLLVEHHLDIDVPQIEVADARLAMGAMASLVHDHPSRALKVLGVTGTNGKSSVVQLLADILNQAGERAEVYGTLTGARTTPESSDLQRQLAASRDEGTTAVAIEVSSHALELSRVEGTSFSAAVFTNLGRDHLDFHGDMESYFAAKAKLFTPAYTPLAIINIDDAHGVRLVGELQRDEKETADRLRVVTYSLDDAADLRFEGPTSHFRWRGHDIALELAGRHNVSNALAAATVAAELGVDDDVIARALAATEPVRGRFEMVDVGQPFVVAIDYAHTPDALAAVLRAGRDMTAERVVLLFGCGGDRDQDKRGEMGSVAAAGADVVIVTSDNPRSENPAAIIDSIVAGMTDGPAVVTVEPDRRRAIGLALREAQPGDLVILAGKGHETLQVIGDRELPFDDRQVALEELGAMT